MKATDELNEFFPVESRLDADYEVYSALHRENRMLRWGAGLLACCFGLSAGSAYQFSHRKPVIFITRVSDVGLAQAIKYTSTEFTPDDAVVRSNLYAWAKLRYTLNRETAGRDYMHNYYFLSDKLSMQAMEQDRSTQKVSKVIAGQGNPNELEILSVQIQNLGTIKEGGRHDRGRQCRDRHRKSISRGDWR